ncbi:MAG TPA: hypothetical protein PKA82_08455 [Pyrinomonadaceae bacterium]|nr:hypothetical protein [Pyrinomonadaceae bacterium]
MYIAKYDPFRDIRSLQDEVNRLFSNSVASNRDEAMSGAWLP